MRLKKEPRKPTFGALKFTAGGRDVHLFPGDPFTAATQLKRMKERVAEVYGDVENDLEITEAASALLVRELWDDCEIEFAPAVDPDLVAELTGEALKDAAIICRLDWRAVSTRRLGIDIQILGKIYPYAVMGFDGDAMAEAIASAKQETGAPQVGEA